MQAVTLTVGTAAIEAVGPMAGGGIVQADPANTADIYLGGPSVTADTTATGGWRLQAGVSLPFRIDGNDQLWAISSAAGQLLRVVVGTDQADLGD